MKSIKGLILAAVAVVIALIIFGSAAFEVQPNQAALVIRLGKIQRIEEKEGLHFMTPFIDHVAKVYVGDILYDIPTSDVITSDKKSMIADDYVVWSVNDPTKFYQTLGAIRGRAEERIEAAV